MPDQTSLTGDMARVAADLLDELALVGAVPYSAHVYCTGIALCYLQPIHRRLAADALGLGPGAGAGIVTHHGLVTRQGIEVSVQAYSRIDAEDLRREREDAETAARAAAAVTS